MKNVFVLLFVGAFICLGNQVATASESTHQATESNSEHEIKGKSGANLNLFPPKQQDMTKTTRPQKPALIEPKFNTIVSGSSVTLKWDQVENANSYHLQIATDPAFKWLLVDDWQYAGTSFEQTNLQAGKNYFWRVAAIRSENNASYMKSWFSVNSFSAK